MNRNSILKAALVTLLVLIVFTTAKAQVLMNYQGRLADSTGDPVADDTYVITFSLWSDSTGGSQQWIETHPSVQTSSGLFTVVLGGDSTLHESVFETEPLFMQIMLGYADVIEPRTRLTSVPSAALAKKVVGDIETGEGYLNLRSSDSSLAVSITTEGKGGPAFVRMYNPDPLHPEQTLVQMSSESDGGKFSLYPPGDIPSNPAFTIGLEPTPFRPGYLSFFDPSGSFPHDPYVKMGLDPSPFRGYLEFYDPSSGWADSPMVKMGIEPSPFHKGYIAMYNPEISPPPKMLELSISDETSQWGSYFKMYSMDPGDDEKEIFEISNTLSNGASFKMFNPQPEPPRVYFDVSVNPESGPSMGFYDDIGQVMGFEPMPFNEGFSMYLMDPGDDGKLFELTGNHITNEVNMYLIDPVDKKELLTMSGAHSSGASFKMFNPQPEPPAVVLDMTVEQVIGPSGNWAGYFNMYSMDPTDEGGKNFEISNMASSGANLKLFNAQPGKASTTVIDMYYDSTNGGGTVRCESDADGSFTYRTGRDLYLGTDYGPGIYMHYGGAGYFAANLGIGVIATTNILEVQQSSATDPIADAWTTYGSKRWKKNIRPIENALDKINQLQGVSFDWIKDDKPDIGLIAEEVGEVIPEVVTYEDNGVDARSIDYNRLTALLIEAVKELKTENEELRKKITEIEAQL